MAELLASPRAPEPHRKSAGAGYAEQFEYQVGSGNARTAGQQGYQRDPERVDQGGERGSGHCLLLDRSLAVFTCLSDRQRNEEESGQRSRDGDTPEIEVCVAHERDDAGAGDRLDADTGK